MTDSMEKDFADNVPLAVDVAPEDGVIVDVGPYTHRVVWAGETEPSCVAYCNNCGSPFFLQGALKKEVDLQQRIIKACGQCGVFMGWVI